MCPIGQKVTRPGEDQKCWPVVGHVHFYLKVFVIFLTLSHYCVGGQILASFSYCFLSSKRVHVCLSIESKNQTEKVSQYWATLDDY